MSDAVVLGRLRHFLLALAGFMSVGTLLELALAEHWGDVVQIIPFVLAGLSLVVIVRTLLQPQRSVVQVLRWLMVMVLAGSLLGVYEHIANNLEFAREIHPNAAITTLFIEALAGANPLLAPGVLAFTALLALAVTYYHPALAKATVKE
jgi:hypothetical protein